MNTLGDSVSLAIGTPSEKLKVDQLEKNIKISWDISENLATQKSYVEVYN